jgi:hypothetical protein
MNGAHYSSPSPERQLAAVPPSRFVAERDRLATAMARAGDRAGAAALKKLKKPTRALWALNQLAREDGAACEELFAASDALSAVQRTARGDLGAFREALAQQRRQFDALTERARLLLEAAGEASDEATLARVTRGLRAAAVGGPVREALREGTLQEEPEEPGFLALADGFGGGESPAENAPEDLSQIRAVRAADATTSRAAEHRPAEGHETKRAHAAEIRRAKLRAARDEAREKAAKGAEAAEVAATALRAAEADEATARQARDRAAEEITRLRAALEKAEAEAHALSAALAKRSRAVAEASSAWRAAVNRATHLAELAEKAARALEDDA